MLLRGHRWLVLRGVADQDKDGGQLHFFLTAFASGSKLIRREYNLQKGI